ncbi:MAG: hypothetical protein R3A10_05780 [Caldilineaceae bacterium]
MAADGHVHELAWMSYLDPYTAGWYHLDVSNETRAPAAVDSSPGLTDTAPNRASTTWPPTKRSMNWPGCPIWIRPMPWYHLGVGAEAGAPPVTPGSTLGVTTIRLSRASTTLLLTGTF